MKTTGTILVLPPGVVRILWLLTALGAAAFGLGLYLAPSRAWASLLVSSYIMLELSLAAMFFLAVHSLSGAAWHVALRRIPEAMASVLPIGAAGVLLVLLAYPSLYPWYSSPASDVPLQAFRQAYLQRPFFLARAVVYLACWIGFALTMVRTSRRQDAEGGPRLARRSVRLSAGFLVVLTLTFVPANIDWIMSLETAWASTISGFYDFAGMFAGGLAALVIIVVCVHRLAPTRFLVSPGHLHDLGKLLFAFSTFWMYMWFCQYMLIWYGNISEEAAYYVNRQRSGWAVLFVLNVVLNWGVPFVLLLSQRAKKSVGILMAAAVSILAGRYCDLYLAVLPRVIAPEGHLGLSEIGLPAAAIGIFTLAVYRALGQSALVPAGDPSLKKSLEYGLTDDRDDALEWFPE